MENLKAAHRHASEGKLKYRTVQKINANLQPYLELIHKWLTEHTYHVSKYQVQTLYDRGKKRKLEKLPYFPDRIIQWAIALQIEPTILKSLINETCACIPGRGGHRAAHFIRKYIKELSLYKTPDTLESYPIYCLKLDIKKFYENINHDCLKALIRKKFKDPELLELLDKIIDSNNSDVGVPIGSYLSQCLANFYLNYFDHFVKEQLHIKYYVRYADDMVILSLDKTELHQWFRQIQEYLNKELKLTIKENWQVFPIKDRGIDFVGYRFFPDYTLLRNRTKKRYVQAMKKIKHQIDTHKGCIPITDSDFFRANSYIGWLKWCDSHRLLKKYVEPIIYHLEGHYVYAMKGKSKHFRRRMKRLGINMQ